MKKFNWKDVEKAASHIILEMYQDEWKPDLIVGITQNGMVLATILSHTLEIPLVSISVDLKDDFIGTETNCWLADWAFGINNPKETGISGSRWDPKLRKKILVVDAVNDDGSVFNWIKEDWAASCYPAETDVWKSIWHKTVRFAAMVDYLNSDFLVDYTWKETEDKSIRLPWRKKNEIKIRS